MMLMMILTKHQLFMLFASLIIYACILPDADDDDNTDADDDFDEASIIHAA